MRDESICYFFFLSRVCLYTVLLYNGKLNLIDGLEKYLLLLVAQLEEVGGICAGELYAFNDNM